jgi:uncharacterized repeat protein (TIGR01451 family)
MLASLPVRALASLAGSAVIALGAATAAHASDTIGDTNGATDSCASDQVLAQASTAGAPSYESPTKGVVVSWTYRATGGNPNIKFKIYHATPSASVFYVRSASAERNPGAGEGQIHPNQLNTFTESPGLPIEIGDTLGLTGRAGTGMACITTTSNSDGIRVKNPPDPPPGADSSGFLGSNTKQKLGVTAVVEPDADGDLYGDESQDACPTEASLQTACPVDLEIVKTASADPTVGANLTYTLAVKNNETVNPAPNVNVTDVLPTGATFVSSSSGQGSCSGATTVTCALGNVGAGQSTAVTIVVQPTAAGPLTNTAGVSTGAQDTNSANDSSTVMSNVTAPPPPPVAPILSGLKLTPRSFLAARGSKITYSLSQAASTTLTVHKRARGVRKGKRCVAPPKKKPKRKPKRCTRLVRKGAFSHADSAGPASVPFPRRVGGKKLAPGSYRLQAVARNTGGASKPATASFKVKKP